MPIVIRRLATKLCLLVAPCVKGTIFCVCDNAISFGFSHVFVAFTVAFTAAAAVAVWLEAGIQMPHQVLGARKRKFS